MRNLHLYFVTLITATGRSGTQRVIPCQNGEQAAEFTADGSYRLATGEEVIADMPNWLGTTATLTAHTGGRTGTARS